MRKLRVVIPVLRDPAEAPSGSTRLAWDEALHVAGRGHEVWVVGPSLDDAGHGERVTRDGVNVLTYAPPRRSPLDPRRASSHQRETAALLRRHLPGAIDVLHGHAPLQYAGALGVAGPATRTAYTVHSPAGLEALAAAPDAAGIARLRVRMQATMLRRVERMFLERSRVVHVLSAYTAQLLAEEHALPAERMTRIPGWVDLERFKPVIDRAGLKRSLGWPEGRVLFTLRRLVPRMGLDRLLRAFAEVRKSAPDVSLVMAGDGPLRGELETLSSDLELAGSVRFPGRIPDEALPRMYAAADAFVLPTAALECFGLIALEAFASGRPVLATPVGAIPEVVGAVDGEWLAADVGEAALSSLLDRWARGVLPEHAPEELRAFVERGYAAEERLAELTSAVLGEEG
jgi:glycosyltransferase involved in cell wall biosynthesis